MLNITSVPMFVTQLFRGMPGVWKHQHRLILIWLIVMQALFPGRKSVAALARWTPSDLTEWRCRRLLKAAYWDVHRLIDWWAHQVIAVLPPPEDGVLTLTGDGSDKPKRAKKNPLAQKGRKSKHDPWFFGVRFALLIVSWDVFRLPVAFRLIRPKSHPQYRTENDLFREMVQAFTPPTWAKVVIVEGDAAYGSQANMKMVLQRDADDPDRTWGFVFAIARTWKTVEGKAIDFAILYPAGNDPSSVPVSGLMTGEGMDLTFFAKGRATRMAFRRGTAEEYQAAVKTIFAQLAR